MIPKVQFAQQNTRGHDGFWTTPLPSPEFRRPEASRPRPQQRPVYPWSARRLNLLPPTLLNNTTTPSKPSPSSPPFPRYGHALPATPTAAGELFLFGGLVHESAQNDLYVFSTRDLSATSLQTSGDIPRSRVGPAAALVSSVLIIWGGDTNLDAQKDDFLYFLNLGVSLDGQTLSGLTSVP